MYGLDFGRYALCSGVAVAMLVGCGGSQPPIGATGAIPQSRAIATHADRGGSWMTPGAKKKDLLYLSDVGTNDVSVYSYPTGKLTGTLTGFSSPYGLCVDKAGDVFVTNYRAADVLEYAHGGSSPIATLSDPGYFPAGCSIDPTSGNLAVTNFATTSSGQGDVAIYEHATGSPMSYSDPNLYSPLFCGYDKKGNLFVDGYNAAFAFEFAELTKGSSTFTNITLNESIKDPGGVQWHGKYVAVGGEEVNVIYHFTISGENGTKVGSTPLDGASNVVQFWIQGSHVIGPDAAGRDVGIWKYPVGGDPTKTITGFDEPIGSTVSIAK